MATQRIPGVVGTAAHAKAIDRSTLCRSLSPHPGLLDAPVRRSPLALDHILTAFTEPRVRNEVRRYIHTLLAEDKVHLAARVLGSWIASYGFVGAETLPGVLSLAEWATLGPVSGSVERELTRCLSRHPQARRYSDFGGTWPDLFDSIYFNLAPNQGALWARIGEKRAMDFAAKDGRITLEATGCGRLFKRIYQAEAGNAQNAFTNWLWAQLSKRFAASLSGVIIAYTSIPSWHQRIQQVRREALARGAKIDLGGPAPTTDAPLPTERFLPQLGTELMELSDVMLENVAVSAVIILDVDTKQQLHMPREVVLDASRHIH